MLCLIVVLVSMPKAALDWRGGEWRGEVGKGQSVKRERRRDRETRDRQAEDGRRSERLLFCCVVAAVVALRHRAAAVQLGFSESSRDKDVYPSIFQKPVEDWSSAQLDAVNFLKLEEHATLMHLDRFEKE